MNNKGAEDSQPRRKAQDQPHEQSGGVSISGGQNTFQGDVVGRDKIDYSRQTGFSAEALESIFKPLVQAIQQAPVEKQQEASQKVEALKEEVAKGKGDQAKDSRMAALIDGIVELVPGAVSALVGMFATPVLGSLVGPVTEFVLDKMRGK